MFGVGIDGRSEFRQLRAAFHRLKLRLILMPMESFTCRREIVEQAVNNRVSI